MSERIHLTLDDALFIHAEQLRLFGGDEGVRDEGLLVSGLLRPRTGYYADLIEEASALWESLAMNHAFVDGNKRVSLACTLVFLELNGLTVKATPDELISFIHGHLEAGTFRKEVLEGWLRAHTRPVTPP